MCTIWEPGAENGVTCTLYSEPGARKDITCLITTEVSPPQTWPRNTWSQRKSRDGSRSKGLIAITARSRKHVIFLIFRLFGNKHGLDYALSKSNLSDSYNRLNIRLCKSDQSYVVNALHYLIHPQFRYSSLSASPHSYHGLLLKEKWSFPICKRCLNI